MLQRPGLFLLKYFELRIWSIVEYARNQSCQPQFQVEHLEGFLQRKQNV